MNKQLELLSRFTFHAPDQTGVEQMTKIRRAIRRLAVEIDELCPESREKAHALTMLQTVMMFANSAIVQRYPINPDDVALEFGGDREAASAFLNDLVQRTTTLREMVDYGQRSFKV